MLEFSDLIIQEMWSGSKKSEGAKKFPKSHKQRSLNTKYLKNTISVTLRRILPVNHTDCLTPKVFCCDLIKISVMDIVRKQFLKKMENGELKGRKIGHWVYLTFRNQEKT